MAAEKPPGMAGEEAWLGKLMVRAGGPVLRSALAGRALSVSTLSQRRLMLTGTVRQL